MPSPENRPEDTVSDITRWFGHLWNAKKAVGLVCGTMATIAVLGNWMYSGLSSLDRLHESVAEVQKQQNTLETKQDEVQAQVTQQALIAAQTQTKVDQIDKSVALLTRTLLDRAPIKEGAIQHHWSWSPTVYFLPQAQAGNVGNGG